MRRPGQSFPTRRSSDLNVVAPVHDALMIEGPADAIEEVVARTQEAMAEASAIVLAGFRRRPDATIVRWPDRYMDDRGREIWGRVMALLPAELEVSLESALYLPIPATFDEETGAVFPYTTLFRSQRRGSGP